MNRAGGSGRGVPTNHEDTPDAPPISPTTIALDALDVEVRAMGPDPARSALTGLDRAGDVRFPMTALAVPAARIHEMVPLLQGTGMDLVAVHEEPLGDVSRQVRRSLASGADEVEVPWSALPATVDAIGYDTPISCDITAVEPDKRASIAHLAFGRGARLLRCSIEDLGILSALDRVHQHQRIKVDLTGYDVAKALEILTGYNFGHPTRLSIHA
jgi:hypothetical protein